MTLSLEILPSTRQVEDYGHGDGESLGENIRNEVYYVMAEKRFRNSLISSKTYPRAYCYSDHFPIISKIRALLNKPRSNKKDPLIDYGRLKKHRS